MLISCLNNSQNPNPIILDVGTERVFATQKRVWVPASEDGEAVGLGAGGCARTEDLGGGEVGRGRTLARIWMVARATIQLRANGRASDCKCTVFAAATLIVPCVPFPCRHFAHNSTNWRGGEGYPPPATPLSRDYDYRRHRAELAGRSLRRLRVGH